MWAKEKEGDPKREMGCGRDKAGRRVQTRWNGGKDKARRKRPQHPVSSNTPSFPLPSLFLPRTYTLHIASCFLNYHDLGWKRDWSIQQRDANVGMLAKCDIRTAKNGNQTETCAPLKHVHINFTKFIPLCLRGNQDNIHICTLRVC